MSPLNTMFVHNVIKLIQKHSFDEENSSLNKFIHICNTPLLLPTYI